MLHWKWLCFTSCSGRSCQRNGLIHFITSLSICLPRQIYIIIFAQKDQGKVGLLTEHNEITKARGGETGAVCAGICSPIPALLGPPNTTLPSPRAHHPGNLANVIAGLSQVFVQEWRGQVVTLLSQLTAFWFGKVKKENLIWEYPFFGCGGNTEDWTRDLTHVGKHSATELQL